MGYSCYNPTYRGEITPFITRRGPPCRVHECPIFFAATLHWSFGFPMNKKTWADSLWPFWRIHVGEVMVDGVVMLVAMAIL